MLKKQSKIKLPWNEIRFVFILAFCFLCAGCAGNKVTPEISSQEPADLSPLPPQLQVEPLSFDYLLQSYDFLNDKNRIIALKHFLAQNNLDDRQKAEAAYMLARLIQQSADAAQGQALQLFDQAQTYPPLKIKSLWHKSEIAAILGKEKLVRQVLATLLPELKDQTSIAAAQYSLAQSYVRAGEIDNAIRLLKQIRVDFPGTDYAIGAGYYLGTLSPQNARAYYFEYLQASPNGHFTADILLKLEKLARPNILPFKESELVAMANAYSAIGEYKSSLACWQKAGTNKHLLPVASCLLRLGQIRPAQEKFFESLAEQADEPGGSGRMQCAPTELANEISSRLKHADSIRFWQKLRGFKGAFQDKVLWNLAIRSNFTDALRYYQDLITHYPDSTFAPEAQWVLLWHKFKSTKTIWLPALSELFHKAAIKYNQCSLTPRFLFWAGKTLEKGGNKQRACSYFKQVSSQFPYSYYGQRAAFRLNSLISSSPDIYFKLQYSGVKNNTDLPWNWPPPEKSLKDLGNPTLGELIYIKQYQEALLEGDKLSAKLVSWLQAMNGQPWLAINTAYACLQDKSCSSSDSQILRQYSFPLLYNRDISCYCRNSGLDDPVLVQALIREESRYNPQAVSSAHALGLCQLMPATASSIAVGYGIKLKNKDQLFQPQINMRLGISYLSSALHIFNNEPLLAVAGYNAGINAVKSFTVGARCTSPLHKARSIADPDQFVEDFPFSETRDYIRKVFSSRWSYDKIYEHQ